MLCRQLYGPSPPLGTVPVLLRASQRGMNPSSITMLILCRTKKSQVLSMFTKPVSLGAGGGVALEVVMNKVVTNEWVVVHLIKDQ